MFSRLTSFFPFSIEFLKNYKKLPMPPTPTPPHQLPYTLTRTTVRCPLIRERDVTLGGGGYVGGGGSWGCPLTRERGVRRGWGVRGGMGVHEGGTSCVGGSTLGVSTLGGGGVWYVGGGVWYVGGFGTLRGVVVMNCCFWPLFGKLLHIGGPWRNVFVQVLQKIAKIRVIVYEI